VTGEKMKGADAIAECLKAQGVEVTFGMRGLHITPLASAVKRRGMRFIEVRHEQSAAFMADAYTRVTGMVGVVLSATGAGTASTMIGIQEAYGSSSPLLLIASQIEQTHLGKGWGDLHEVKSQHGLIASAAEACLDVTAADDIPGAIHEIFHKMLNARPRPYGLEVPADLLTSAVDRGFSYQSATRAPKLPETAKIEEAVAAISRAHFPVIYAGGGAIAANATQVVEELAGVLNAPVLSSIKGKGVISENHELSLGNLGTELPIRRLLQVADLAIVVGTRFSNRSTGKWALRLAPRWVRVDIDPAQFVKTHPAITPADAIELVGDAQATVAAILQKLKRTPQRPRGFDRSAIRKAKQEVFDGLRKGAPHEMQLLHDLRKALRSDAIVANDSTVATYWTRRYFEVLGPRTFLWPMGTGTIGFGLPAAIGAKIAHPERQVIALCGDGGFLYSCPDLATALKYRAPIQVLLFNDNAFGIVDYGQQRDDRLDGDETLANPDFVGLAKSFGAEAERINALDKVGDALERALRRNRLTVIEIPVALGVPPDLA
jgi:thiamine pyrophosphate-dependent acetolactate synthase large subunit-like protein